MQSSVLILLVSCISVCQAILGIGRQQSVSVSGRLICNGQPASGVKIKLYDVEVTLDRLLQEGQTDQNGVFRVGGSATEISNIDPKLNIYHRCNYNGICYKKVSIKIPDQFISDGSTARQTYDIGTLNLANQFSGESTDCIN
ncbi:hypothetical protein WR25_06807 [Diploscapter pachys]|uniref:Transthyretin-like family protein n=1 Tax=Diploscapter pachys TaxID=2018661 RepID=A0A2A2LMX2_9BILA|nr:hypothetical protein WR25_06807 [Diploscapter pachys]